MPFSDISLVAVLIRIGSGMPFWNHTPFHSGGRLHTSAKRLTYKQWLWNCYVIWWKPQTNTSSTYNKNLPAVAVVTEATIKRTMRNEQCVLTKLHNLSRNSDLVNAQIIANCELSRLMHSKCGACRKDKNVSCLVSIIFEGWGILLSFASRKVVSECIGLCRMSAFTRYPIRALHQSGNIFLKT